MSKFNKGISFLLCVIDVFSNTLELFIWKIKNITITNAFQKKLDESNSKPSQIWVDTGSEFYERTVKSWLEKNATEMYSTHNKEKHVVGERFIRTWKKKIYTYLTLSKNLDY